MVILTPIGFNYLVPQQYQPQKQFSSVENSPTTKSPRTNLGVSSLATCLIPNDNENNKNHTNRDHTDFITSTGSCYEQDVSAKQTTATSFTPECSQQNTLNTLAIPEVKLTSMPPELLGEIFLRLHTVEDARTLSRTCRILRQIGTQYIPALWQKKRVQQQQRDGKNDKDKQCYHCTWMAFCYACELGQ